MLKTIITFIKRRPSGSSLLRKYIFNITGIHPGKIELYRNALTHKSVINKSHEPGQSHNERLEYLGDAILSAVIADYLFSNYPNLNEGFLTRMRSGIVNRENLNKIGLKMGLDKHMFFCQGSIVTRKHIFGNALEAITGAIYLDKGYNQSRQFIINKIIPDHFELTRLASDENDYKSQLIQWGQKNKTDISFDSIELYGENGVKPRFQATIHILNTITGTGHGDTKKEAQQHAARQALLNISS